MKIIYMYVMNDMALWEMGYLQAAVSMKEEVKIATVSLTKDPIRTLGGISILPDMTIEAIENPEVVILPGGNEWQTQEAILNKVKKWLAEGVVIGAICGATLALAQQGILNEYKHTSNALDYLKLTTVYKGDKMYQNVLAYKDNHLITANAAGSLLFAKYILSSIDVFDAYFIENWYNYYNTGESKYIMALL